MPFLILILNKRSMTWPWTIFNYQFKNNKVYRSFCDLLYIHPSDVKTLEQIPFLPIQFFKTHNVLSSQNPIQTTFTSSGTTGSTTSKHFVTDLYIYEKSFQKGLSNFMVLLKIMLF